VERNTSVGTQETLRVLERLELSVASFYGLCAERTANGSEFWATLAREEVGHAAAVRRTAAILAERPDRFEPSRAFQLPAIQTFIAYVDSLAERLRTGEISQTDQHRLLTLARDLEQSVIEGKWSEIVKTTDAECRALLRGIVSETRDHQARIATRLAGTPKGT
jgi:rubrerythrin